ncbi:MAG TPA: lipocalin family protein [Flavobacterium sp.]|nr:lipocalin family protein [Flavobacterium sp.]
MRKSVLFTVLTIFTLTSCEDDLLRDDGNRDLLTGKWNMIKGEKYQGRVLIDSQNMSSEGCTYNYYKFLTDGTKNEVYHNFNEDCAVYNYDGTWSYSIKNKQITLIDNEDGYLFVAEIVSINETDLKVKVISDGGDNPNESGLEVYYFLEKAIKNGI